MLQKWKSKQEPLGRNSQTRLPTDLRYGLNEFGLGLLASLFLACCIAIFCLLQITVIPILTASRIFISFGLIGFATAFLLRKKLNWGILDGLYYNVFAVAPICMLVFLTLNMLCSDTYTEQYEVVSYDLHGNQYSFELENDAYADYWRIRTVDIESRPARTSHIEFTFCDGLFGYKVLKDTRLF